MKTKSSKLSEKDILHVAELAKLTVKGGEIGKFRNQLSNIFEYVNQISEMKTKGVVETSQTTGITNRFREDNIDKKRMLTQGQALSNAKSKHKGFFVVKAIFEK